VTAVGGGCGGGWLDEEDGDNGGAGTTVARVGGELAVGDARMGGGGAAQSQSASFPSSLGTSELWDPVSIVSQALCCRTRLWEFVCWGCL